MHVLISESTRSGPMYPAKKLDGMLWRVAPKALTVTGTSVIEGEKIQRAMRITPNQLFFITGRTVVRQDGQYVTNVSAQQMGPLVACKKALKREYALIVERLNKRQTSLTPTVAPKQPPKPANQAKELYDSSAYTWYKYVGKIGTRVEDRSKSIMLRDGDVWGHHQDSKRVQIIMVAKEKVALRISDAVKFARLLKMSKKSNARPKLDAVTVTAPVVALKQPAALASPFAADVVNEHWAAMEKKLAASKKVPRVNEWFPCVLGTGNAQVRMVMYKTSSRSVVRLAQLVQSGGNYTLHLFKVKGNAVMSDGTKDLSSMTELARRVLVSRYNATVAKAQARNTTVPVVQQPNNPAADTTQLQPIPATTAPRTLHPAVKQDAKTEHVQDGIIDIDELEFDAGDDLVDMIRRNINN